MQVYTILYRADHESNAVLAMNKFFINKALAKKELIDMGYISQGLSDWVIDGDPAYTVYIAPVGVCIE